MDEDDALVDAVIGRRPFDKFDTYLPPTMGPGMTSHHGGHHGSHHELLGHSSPGQPRSRVALRDWIAEEYEATGLTRRLTRLDSQVRHVPQQRSKQGLPRKQ